jgi:nickel superoxide dismutase
MRCFGTSTRLAMTVLVGVCVLVAFLAPRDVRGHCQIPCGIYDDDVQFTLLAQHVETMVRSAQEIQRLLAEEPDNVNQLTRWVINKDEHADAFAEIITDYFLTQRIALLEGEAGRDAYLQQLELAHRLLVGAMRVKQSDDPAVGEALGETLADFQAAYEATHTE